METTPLSTRTLDTSRGYLLLGLACIMLMYAGIWQMNVAGLFAHVHHAATATHDAAHQDTGHHVAGEVPAIGSVVPFAILLGCIAILPVLSKTEHWWERNWNRLYVSLGCAGATLLYYAFFYADGVTNHLTHLQSHAGWETAAAVLSNAWLGEYIPFMALLFSLYVISGGIVISGKLVGRPSTNLALIGIGTLLASFIGTTGAAMLLIRPLLRANSGRKYVAHTIVFFIFTVCNTGGCLLPVGDPPLFLGFLHGVNFTWTLSLWPMWLTMNAMLLVTYYVFDAIQYRREPKPTESTVPATVDAHSTGRIRVGGALNFVWLIGVVFAVALLDPSRAFPGTNWHPPLFYREIVIFGLTALSMWFTPSKLRMANSFNFDAILEVAALFLGIFVCMQPAIQLLNVYGPELGFDSSWKFFWGTGLLSSCLDNAPTYVVFFETAKTVPSSGSVVAGVPETFLVGISLGAVFLGAMTYIGNGPNLMVKAIAESQQIKMPSFFGYIMYSVAAVLPTAIVVTLMFLV